MNNSSGIPTAAPAPHEELISLFAKTVTALSTDASYLRELSSVHLAISQNDDKNRLPNINNDDGNDTSTPKDGYEPPEIQKLRKMDEMITTLEQRVVMIRELIAEEKESLFELEEVKFRTEEQTRRIESILEGCRSIRLPGGDERKRNHNGADNNNDNNNNNSDADLLSAVMKQLTIENESNNNPHHHHPSSSSRPIINLPLVTETELSTVSRNTRGRITLAALNDAVADIARVCHKKYETLDKSHGKKTTTKRYRRQLAEHLDLDCEEHEGKKWVSEQDLRDSCAFFRSGEASARSVLGILRFLKRLKQVNVRSQVTYVLE